MLDKNKNGIFSVFTGKYKFGVVFKVNAGLRLVPHLIRPTGDWVQCGGIGGKLLGCFLSFSMDSRW